MKKEIKPSDILRKAAMIINTDLSKSTIDRGGACNAISRADEHFYRGAYYDSKQTKRARQLFASLFQGERGQDYNYWFTNKEGKEQFCKSEQDHRIMALLMTAEMAESVGE